MDKTRKIVVVLGSVFCLVLLGSTAFAQPFAPAGEPEMFCPPQICFNYRAVGYHTFEASWLIGYRVTDTHGGSLGQISSLVIDNTNGRIALVVLSDVPNLGDKQLAIPYNSIVRTGENTFEFNPGNMAIQTGSLQGTPYSNHDSDVYTVTVGPSDSEFFGLPSKITPAWVADVYRHYGQEPYWKQPGEKPLASLELYQSTKLMGAEVQMPKGEEVAMINDLVIDPHGGRIAFVVLSNVVGRGDTLVAVPFSDLSRRAENVFVLNAKKSQVAVAPSFDELADLSNLSWAVTVYNYFGQHPYWTKEGTR